MNVSGFVEFIIKKIIQCLQTDTEYGFSENEIRHLYNLSNPDIHVLEKSKSQKLNITCIDDPDFALNYDISIKMPQTIDPIPVFRNGSVLRFLPTIVIPEDFSSIKEKWVIVHEICHLLSIGEYAEDDRQGMYQHCFGINQYYYNSHFKLIDSVTDDRLNEIINDAVTWHFMEIMYDCHIQPLNAYIDFHCQPIKEMKIFKTLVRYYFCSMGKEIYRLLK